MAERIIRAKVEILGDDQFGPAQKSVLEKIARINRALETSGKASGMAAEVDRVTAALGKTEAAIRAIDRYSRAQGGIDAKLQRVLDTRLRMTSVERQIAANGYEVTRKLERERDIADRQLRAANEALRTQRTAADEAKGALEGMGISVEHLASEEARLTGAVNRSAEAFERQGNAARQAAVHEAEAAHQRRRFGEGVLGGGTIGMGAAYIGGRTVAATVRQGAELSHELVRMRASGMEPGEIDEARNAAMELSGKYRSFSSVEILHMLRNVRSIVGNYDEAAQVADPLLALRTVALGAHPEHAAELEGDFDKLVKGMEIKGVTQNLPAFRRYMEGMAKAINVFGDTLRPTDYYAMFKYGRQSTNATSEDFMLQVAATLAQDLGGSSAGKGLQNVYQHLIGGHMEHTAVQDMYKLGLIDPRKVSRTKTGAIKGVLPGGVRGTDMPGGWNFYKWINETYLPALARHGITDPNDIQQHIATDFGTGTATQVATIFATQQARIEKDKNLVALATGLEAAPDFMKNDPVMGLRELTAQFDNLLQAAASPAGTTAAHVLYGIAGGLQALAAGAKDHPYLTARGAGGVGVAGIALAGYSAWKLLAAGPALSGAAAELTAAALALKGAAGANGIGTAARPSMGLPSALNGKAPGIGLGRSAATGATWLVLAYEMWERGVGTKDYDGKPIFSSVGGLDTQPKAGSWQADPTGPLLSKLEALFHAPVKIDPAGLKGAMDGSVKVGVTVKVDGPGTVTDTHTSTSGSATHASLGTSMDEALSSGGVW